jgi:hypothetical protein
MISPVLTPKEIVPVVIYGMRSEDDYVMRLMKIKWLYSIFGSNIQTAVSCF